MSGRNYKSTPTIMLKGQWLEDLGLRANVRCEDGKLTITLKNEIIEE